jgi:hypothetical protein
MKKVNIKRTIGQAFMLGLIGLMLSSVLFAGDDTIQSPDLPAECSQLNPGQDQVLIFHAYATGVQVYRWNGSAWIFVEPIASLFADSNYRGLVATHYAGPTWESKSGSKVVATKDKGCSPDSNAIDWLLLSKVSTEGPGIFSSVTYVQRLNTNGGKAPSTPGTTVGDKAKVPYTAEYYFYRKQG